MNSYKLSDSITRMAWIDRLASPIQNLVSKIYKAKSMKGVERFFHGAFVGHPLHPALVHLPIGCFTLAAITDLFIFNPTAAAVSDVAIWVGVIAAIPAALAGFTDWFPYGDTSVRRIGGLHMLLNLAAVALYLISLAFRATDSYGADVFFGYLGFIAVGFSGYLGGVLAYEKRIGTDHAPQPEDEAAPEQFIAVMRMSDLEEGKPTKARIQDVPIVLVKRANKVYAMAHACAHEGGPLSEGEFKNDCLICPWHGSAFRLRDGAVVAGPSVYPQPTFPTRIRNGFVEVLAVRQLETVEYRTPQGSASLR